MSDSKKFCLICIWEVSYYIFRKTFLTLTRLMSLKVNLITEGYCYAIEAIPTDEGILFKSLANRAVYMNTLTKIH